MNRSRSNLRQQFALFLILVLVGAVISYGVAFAIGKWGEKPYEREIAQQMQAGIPPPYDPVFDDYGNDVALTSHEIELWKKHAMGGWPDPPTGGLEHVFWGLRYLNMLVLTGDWEVDDREIDDIPQEEWKARRESRNSFTVWILECGWPVHCVGCESWYSMKGWKRVPIHYSARKIGNHSLPDRILWGGLLINTIFYAVILWGMIFVPRFTRRKLRERRGLCPLCAYDLRGNPSGVTGCSECGWGRLDVADSALDADG